MNYLGLGVVGCLDSTYFYLFLTFAAPEPLSTAAIAAIPRKYSLQRFCTLRLFRRVDSALVITACAVMIHPGSQENPLRNQADPLTASIRCISSRIRTQITVVSTTRG